MLVNYVENAICAKPSSGFTMFTFPNNNQALVCKIDVENPNFNIEDTKTSKQKLDVKSLDLSNNPLQNNIKFEVMSESEESKEKAILKTEVRVIFKRKEGSKIYKEEFGKTAEDTPKSEKGTKQEAILLLAPRLQQSLAKNDFQSIKPQNIHRSPLALFLQHLQIETEHTSNEDSLTDGIIFGIQSISKPFK